jgi:hypothetical protein
VNEEQDGPILPRRATGIFLGAWMAVMLALAFLVVPAVFSTCTPGAEPSQTASP